MMFINDTGYMEKSNLLIILWGVCYNIQDNKRLNVDKKVNTVLDRSPQNWRWIDEY